MPIPPPPAGFTLDTPQAPTVGGRPIVRRGAEPPKPNLPTGWQLGPDGVARPVSGLPSEFTNPKQAGKDAPTGYRFTANGNLEVIPGGPADKSTNGDPLKEAVKGLGLDELLANVKRGREQVNNTWSTGVLGGLSGAAPWPGTDRKDFLGTLGAIQGGIILEKLQALKDASKTGASGMGALSEKEGERLASAVAALTNDMSGEAYNQSFDIIERHANVLRAVGDGKDPNDPAVQKAYNIKPLDGQNKQDTPPPGVAGPGDIGFNTPPQPKDPLTPEQQSAYDAFWKVNPKASADQLRQFGASIGVNIDNADAIIEARDKGAGVQPGANAVPGLTKQEQDEVKKRAAETGPLSQIGAGMADTLTLGAGNKIIAAGRDLAGKGEYDRELLKANAVTDQIARDHPFLYHGGQLGAGLVLPFGEARTPAQLAKIGGAYGAAYGLGSSDHLADVPANVLIGGAGGAAGGPIGGVIGEQAGNVLGRLGSRRASGEGRQVYDAAERIGMVDQNGNAIIMPADVGGTFTRKMTSAGAQGPISAMPIVKGANRVTEAAQAARSRIAQSVGTPAEIEAAGQAASRGSDAFIKRTSARGSEIYKRAEAAAGDAKVPLPNAIAAVDRNIAELSQSPTGSQGLEVLQGLRDSLGGEFSVNGIRQMRTQLRDQFIKEGLRGSDLERRVNEVVGAASQDIVDGLAAQGKNNAAGLYKLADRYWRARVDTIDNVLQPIIGRRGEKSGEEVMAAINRASVGNNARLSGLMKALPAEDQATVRATLIDNLGKAAGGAQNADGTVFSLSSFLTHWNKMSPGAKRTLFQGETRAALDDLAKVAEGSKAAQRHGNFSNTAGGMTGQFIMTGGPLYYGGVLGAAASALSQYGAGKLLASPRFARWLVAAGRTTNPVAHINRLGSIAAKEGAIATEITGLRQALLRSVNDNAVTMPAAAESQGNESR